MEKPILFNTEMVQAILDGRKTSTRRPVKYDFKKVYTVACFNGKWYETYGENLPNDLIEWYVKEKAKPPYQLGDILWVRETWSTQYDGIHDSNGYGRYVYKADGTLLDNSEGISSSRWYPSIFMPRKAARLFLRVTDVRVERVQDITEDGALKEGIQTYDFIGTNRKAYGDNLYTSSKLAFQYLWNSLYGNWNENPWVWVIEFERVEKNGSLV